MIGKYNINHNLVKTTLFITAMAVTGYGYAGGKTELLEKYRSEGAQAFSADRGKALWEKTFIDRKSGQKRACTTCHTNNLRATGKHARTGKAIKPMAPSVNPARYEKAKKTEKWFRRNCKWTFGRICTPQEKGDFLEYLSRQ